MKKQANNPTPTAKAVASSLAKLIKESGKTVETVWEEINDRSEIPFTDKRAFEKYLYGTIKYKNIDCFVHLNEFAEYFKIPRIELLTEGITVSDYVRGLFENFIKTTGEILNDINTRFERNGRFLFKPKYKIQINSEFFDLLELFRQNIYFYEEFFKQDLDIEEFDYENNYDELKKLTPKQLSNLGYRSNFQLERFAGFKFIVDKYTEDILMILKTENNNDLIKNIYSSETVEELDKNIIEFLTVYFEDTLRNYDNPNSKISFLNVMSLDEYSLIKKIYEQDTKLRRYTSKTNRETIDEDTDKLSKEVQHLFMDLYKSKYTN